MVTRIRSRWNNEAQTNNFLHMEKKPWGEVQQEWNLNRPPSNQLKSKPICVNAGAVTSQYEIYPTSNNIKYSHNFISTSRARQLSKRVFQTPYILGCTPRVFEIPHISSVILQKIYMRSNTPNLIYIYIEGIVYLWSGSFYFILPIIRKLIKNVTDGVEASRSSSASGAHHLTKTMISIADSIGSFVSYEKI